MLFKVSISWCIISRSSEDEGSNDVKGTLKVFATRHLSADTLLPLSRYPAADNLLSAGPFLHQLALHVVTSLYKAKIKPRAADGLKVGEDLCVIWNGATFQLFQINGLILESIDPPNVLIKSDQIRSRKEVEVQRWRQRLTSTGISSLAVRCSMWHIPM